MQLLLTKNKGHVWWNHDNSFFKGYIQTNDNGVMKGDDALNFLSEPTDFDGFVQKLRSVYGVFAIIIEKHEEIWGAVDIARSMPIYYSIDGKCISDDSEAMCEYLGIDSNDANSLRLLELYQSFFISYGNTVFDRIKQLSAGQCFRIHNKKIYTEFYYLHNAKPIEMNWQDALIALELNTKKMMERMEAVVNGKTIVLSLSGGHDSRYLACSLKQYGFKSVICYTYGKSDSLEVVSAQRIAKELGFKWINIEYTDYDIKDLLSNSEYLAYCKQHDCEVYLQNYIAVKKIKESKLVPDDSVFITGLCNDMPTGQYIPSEEDLKEYSYDAKGLTDYLYNHRFVRSKLTNEIETQFKKEILFDIHNKGIVINDYNSFIHGIDSVVTDYEHTRRFLKMNNAHEFFGYEWLLPCWDKDLLRFWYEIPVEYRKKQRLYNRYIENTLLRLGVKENDIFGATYSHNQTILKLKRVIGGAIVCFMYTIGRPLKRKEDINNFAPLELELFRLIKNKKPIKMKYAGLLYLLGIYTIENRYGIDWFNSLCMNLKD